MMPFIPTPETFLSLALCGSIRDKIVPPPILADFLLFHMNLMDPELYTSVYDIPPTNNVIEFLAGVARKTGKLLPGGYVDEKAAAMDAISRFRKAGLGHWTIDKVTPDAFDRRIKEELVARQRESRGNGDVIESRKKTTKSIILLIVLIGGIKKGVMGSAIASGREDAMKSLGKGKRGNSGSAKMAVNFKVGRVGVRAKQPKGVRKAVNRNKGAKSRKR
jgi:hypothetical protein